MTAHRCVIVGAGPTGLGAAHRLVELGEEDFVVLEASDAVGGLARSVTDDAGFTFDIGGHVLFSHFEYYDRLVDGLLRDDYREIGREAWVWMEQQRIPYPFQNNFGALSRDTVSECLAGLLDKPASAVPVNFREWVLATFGCGIARHFMLPYNWKVWATPADVMSYAWIADRVAVVDISTVLRNVILGEQFRGWGPNTTFRYPTRGTGQLFERLGDSVRDHVRFRAVVVDIDVERHEVTTADGRSWRYDHLLSSMPLDDLVRYARAPPAVRRAADGLVSTSTHVTGLGIDRPTTDTASWVYFPEASVPFHRVTYLSNYSPALAPRQGQTVLLAETSSSRHKPVDRRSLSNSVIDGLVGAGVLAPADVGHITTVWEYDVAKSYPVPTLNRDGALAVIEVWLAAHQIASRGRFGTWRYEIGNMDHSCMQGVEWVDRVVLEHDESVWHPACA